MTKKLKVAKAWIALYCFLTAQRIADRFTDWWGRKRRYEAACRLCSDQHLRIRELEKRLARQCEAEAAGDYQGLSPAEVERIAILAEECGEVVQICGKILRHGWESCSPFDSRCRPNSVLLERELGSVRATMDLMFNAGDVRRIDVQTWREMRSRVLRKWTHHQTFEKQGIGNREQG